MRDLHSALKTTVMEKVNTTTHPGAELALVKLQYGKNEQAFSIHIRPSGWSTAGLQLTDLLAYLGFERQRCAFVGSECYVREIQPNLEFNVFASSLSRMYSLLDSAEKKLSSCGFFLPQPEGWGFFHGKSSKPRRRPDESAFTDGHNAPKSKKMKEVEDDYFRFVFTWLDGGTIDPSTRLNLSRCRRL